MLTVTGPGRRATFDSFISRSVLSSEALIGFPDTALLIVFSTTIGCVAGTAGVAAGVGVSTATG